VSWKAIAEFFDRDQRTVMRWESQCGLPIHRVPGRERGGVFAYQSELVAWLNSHKQETEEGRERASAGEVAAAASDQGTGQAGLGSEAGVGSQIAAVPEQSELKRSRSWLLPSVGLVVAIGICLMIFGAYVRKPADAKGGHAVGAGAGSASKDAQELYLQGRYFWEHRTEGNLNKAVDAYTRAIVADSNYAEAYAGLAESYDLMPEYTDMPAGEAFPRAVAAAEKALALDDSLASAHRSLAFALFWSLSDVPRAMREFERAIQLDPNDADAHHWYATALEVEGNFAKSEVEIDRAQSLAPASRSVLADRALIRYLAGEREASLESLREMERNEPDFTSPPRYLSWFDLESGNYAGYIADLKRLSEITGKAEDIAAFHAVEEGYKSGGARGLLRAQKEDQEKRIATNPDVAFDLAQTCALLGERDLAVRYLQLAFNQKSFRIAHIVSADWAPGLNGYKAFEDLRSRVRARYGVD
jgi:tetratricopeptide (TPR) repeat protein